MKNRRFLHCKQCTPENHIIWLDNKAFGDPYSECRSTAIEEGPGSIYEYVESGSNDN